MIANLVATAVLLIIAVISAFAWLVCCYPSF